MLLPLSLQRATDRLLEAVMQVACAVGTFGTNPTSPAQPAYHACVLLQHLSMLVIRLIRLSNNPLPTQRQHTAPATADQPDRDTASSTGADRLPPLCLPRRPGWLLAVLPDAAPAVAAQLAAALADPALAPLLAAVPSLHRDLRPLLRALGLDAPVAPPPSDPSPRRARQAHPPIPRRTRSPASSEQPPPDRQSRAERRGPFTHAQSIPDMQQNRRT